MHSSCCTRDDSFGAIEHSMFENSARGGWIAIDIRLGWCWMPVCMCCMDTYTACMRYARVYMCSDMWNIKQKRPVNVLQLWLIDRFALNSHAAPIQMGDYRRMPVNRRINTNWKINTAQQSHYSSTLQCKCVSLSQQTIYGVEMNVMCVVWSAFIHEWVRCLCCAERFCGTIMFCTRMKIDVFVVINIALSGTNIHIFLLFHDERQWFCSICNKMALGKGILYKYVCSVRVKRA